jgi:DNA-binding beta-propeller fold protein YncE
VDILVGPSEKDRETFLKPYGLAVATGKFYVCDTILGTVWVANFQTGEFHPIAGDRGQGKLKKPINIVVDQDDLKYVTDIERGQIVVFGPKDEYVTAMAEGPPLRPCGVAISGDHLIVSDVGDHEIQIRDKHTGKIIRRFGSPQSSPVEEALGLPVNLAVDSHGNILVSDAGRFRVCVLSPEGTFLGSFGRIGKQAGEFARPKGIATDRENRIYLVDSAFENVQMFDEAHRLLMWFGGHGSEEGALSLPAQVVVDYSNVDYFRKYVAPGRDLEHVIWVTSQAGPRSISCYGFLRPSSEKEAPK